MKYKLVRMNRGSGSPVGDGQGRCRRRQTSGVVFPYQPFVFSSLFWPLVVSVNRYICFGSSRVFFGNKTWFCFSFFLFV